MTETPTLDEQEARYADLLRRRADVHHPLRERHPYYGDADIDLLRSMLDAAQAELPRRDAEIARLNAIVNTPPGAAAMEIGAECRKEGRRIYNRERAKRSLVDCENVAIARAIEAAEARARLKSNRETAPAWEAIGTARRMILDAVQEIGPVGCVKEGDVGPPDPIGEAEAIIAGIQAIEAAAEAHGRAAGFDEGAAQMRERAAQWVKACGGGGYPERVRAAGGLRALPDRETE